MTGIRGISHLTLPVTDLELAERFYIGALGLALERRFDRETFLRLRPDRAAELDVDDGPLHLQLGCGGVQLDLFLQREPLRGPLPPHPHLAFDVSPDDLGPLAARVGAFGVPLDGPRRLGPPGHASIYFTDPFGNLLELAAMGYEGGELAVGPPDLVVLGRLRQ
ncbi:VOC family protein [Paraliomyxa miuraensis]|uniref:VOC family protein n=1 Tax=Paraliomyxa miuraensis TaxID=376150 RepID=UPI002251014A|nr:VOC family protein [Paraliomyxa miuraensis]MCX4240373.1 VOC family protein [Paraliomyxa miuraensis]